MQEYSCLGCSRLASIQFHTLLSLVELEQFFADIAKSPLSYDFVLILFCYLKAVRIPTPDPIEKAICF
jgi:hypothetical protein